MRTAGFSAEIHKVADNDKRLTLFLSLASLFVLMVALNVGLQDVAPRWFQRQFDWLASEDIPPIFLSMAFASLVAAAALWLFSGNGEKLFDIDAEGITCTSMFGSKTYRWSDFELLERQVSSIVLHLKLAARGSLGPGKVTFDISHIDCTGQQLEALIVYYRPDLYRTLHVVRQTPPKDSAVAAPAAPETPRTSPLSQRIARLR